MIFALQANQHPSRHSLLLARRFLHQGMQGDRLDAGGLIVCRLAGIDQIAFLYFQIVAGDMKAFFRFWRGRSFDFYRNVRDAALFKNQIDFRACLRAVEIRRVSLPGVNADQVFDDISFPAGAEYRMPE